MYLYLKNNMKNAEEVGFKRIDEWIDVSFEVNEEGIVENVKFNGDYSDAIQNQVETSLIAMPPWKPAIENGDSISTTVNLEVRVSYSPTVKGMYKRDGLKPTFKDEKVFVHTPEEAEDEMNLMVNTEKLTIKTTSVYKGIELFSGSKKIALVMDVTGSMAGHVAAMIFWINVHNNDQVPFTSYTFFNDGDNKSTKRKKIGETGGIYSTPILADMSSTLKMTMQKGNGGERPENDVEAILYAIENDTEADEILLIGDNFSEVRDLQLLPEVTKPVHVILCSAPKAVRPDYLKIAHDTGGLFIINGKKVDLLATQKGEKILIQGIEYKYTGSDFKNLGEDKYY